MRRWRSISKPGLDRLYEAELADFIGERKQLAGALKKEGRKAEAAQVEELRKPSVPAWTVNQLARRKRKDLNALLAAGEQLEQAQQALLAGGGRAEFNAARQREQAALKQLRDDAVWVLGKRATDATLERVVSTLGSAAVTEDGRARLVAGPAHRRHRAAELRGVRRRSRPRRARAARKTRRPTPKPAGPSRATTPPSAARRSRRRSRQRTSSSRPRATARPGSPTTTARGRARASRTRARRSTRPSARPSGIEAERAAAADAVAAARRELDAAKKA